MLPLLGLLDAWLDPPPAPFALAPPSLVGLITDTRTLELLGRTLALAGCVAVLALPLGFWFAWVERRSDSRLLRWLCFATLLPVAIPSYILAATVRESLGPAGWLPAALAPQSFTGFWPAVLVLTIVTLPYVQILGAAAMARLSGAEEDAARLLGGGARAQLAVVYWPRLRMSSAYALLIVALYVISDFGAVAVLDTQVLTWRLYQAVDHQQLAEAAALAAVILIAAVPLFAAARFLRGGNDRRLQVANPRPPAPVRLTPSVHLLTVLLQVTVVMVGVVLPIATLSGWTLDGLATDARFAPLWPTVLETVAVTLIGTVVLVLCALLPALYVDRLRGGRARWFEDAVYAGSALPGVLLAFGLLLAALALGRMVPVEGFYAAVLGSGILLVLGYLMRFLAEAYASVRSALALVDPRLGETALLLDAPRWRFRQHVLLPLLMPGFAASAILVWLALIKELPVTLLLGGAMGLDTLAFRIYDRYSEAFYHDAGAAGLALLGVALLAAFVTLPWRRHA